MAVVEFVQVTKRYGTTVAVSDLSLRIEHGEFMALLGPSGCGKTTTLNLLAGFVEPTAGAILIDGQSVERVPPHRRNIGMVFQSYALFPHLTVFDNVAFGLRMRRVPAPDVGTRVRRALDLVHLSGLEARYSRELSGGQQQRVALARALVFEPAVLLLDEPLSNLDANLREQMRFEIREIQRRIGITTVFVTHDQGEAMAASDRLAVMQGGQVRQVGTVREIYETPVDAFVAGFIGQANLVPATLERVEDGVASAVAAGGESLITRKPAGTRVSQRVLVVVRPEDVEVSATPLDGCNSLRGRVERVSYLGSAMHVTLRVGDRSFTALSSRHALIPAAGDDVYVTWNPEDCSLIPLVSDA
jgi:spermidine/putrescine ABC transporter ATP-binding subunit